MQTKTKTTSPAPKPDAQPVQAATHTPGPWAAIIGGGGCSVIVNSTVQMPILVQIAPDTLYAHPERVAEAQANARLIAAAPALLAALESMVSTALKVEDKAWASAIDRAGQTRPCDAARAALDAAKGPLDG